MQVDGCNKDLASEKEYYQRYRICEEHLKLSSLLKDGVQQRFCQQCGRFHLLADFDGDKRCGFFFNCSSRSLLRLQLYSSCQRPLSYHLPFQS